MKPELGCCYYPEHWPQERWAIDAQMMVESGLSWVRIGEFAWSRLEPKPGQFEFDWLDRAIDTLAEAGLKIILGTPTATPPRWMLEIYPDMLAVDRDGRVRGFGSRRHYCFSHQGYRQACVDIVESLAQRYGSHPAIQAWQTDNEYGCHDTVHSYSDAALSEFRLWLEQRYTKIERLNQAWGTVFWSMEYASFNEIGLPNLTVTEAAPCHELDFKRFSSDQVVSFNRLQTDILRRYTPAPLIHNYMGRILEFDHFTLGADLDVASWDAYPLGFLEDRCDLGEAWQARFVRQGDPDFQAFHHDLYRAVGRGRWWVMEQQPGPVNWAPFNPIPLDGMVRLWSLEAVAHGAEVVSYFRWRQLPFAQEQHHAGLLTPDGREAQGLKEARQTAEDLEALGTIEQVPAQVALVFDYESAWAWQTQPQGASFDYFRLVFEQYRALRRLGINIDIVDKRSVGERSYKLICAAGLMSVNKDLLERLKRNTEVLLMGPRSGSRSEDFYIDADQPQLFEHVSLQRVESMRAGAGYRTDSGVIEHWFEHYEVADELVMDWSDEGLPVLLGQEGNFYLCGWPDAEYAHSLYLRLLKKLGIKSRSLPDGLRVRETKNYRFWFNYDNQPSQFEGRYLAAADVLIEAKNSNDRK